MLKKTQVPEIHIFQNIKSDWGQLGPRVCKSARNMYKNLAKLSKICPTLRGCNLLNIYQKCSQKTHRYLGYISFRKSSQIWTNLAHKPINWPETCMKIWWKLPQFYLLIPSYFMYKPSCFVYIYLGVVVVVVGVVWCPRPPPQPPQSLTMKMFKVLK